MSKLLWWAVCPVFMLWGEVADRHGDLAGILILPTAILQITYWYVVTYGIVGALV